MKKASLAFALAALIALLAANLAADTWRVQGREPPEYAPWTGVVEVERKIALLREFAREGPVDALVLSSSMGDFGISAQVLTREMSARLGRPYRVFNFSMGGADIGTYPILYRLARLAARPREVWVVSPVSPIPQGIPRGSLDDQLLQGAVGSYARVPGLLPLSYELFRIPIVRNAPAIRDAGMYLHFEHRPVGNLDFYDITRFGDSISWLYNVGLYAQAKQLAIDRRSELLKLGTRGRAELETYLTQRAVAALQELRDEVRRDEASIKLVAFDMAPALGVRDREYLEASALFFETVSRHLQAGLVDVRPSFVMEPHMVSDSIHLNVFGATEFSRLLAARLANQPAPSSPPPASPALVRERLPDPQWTAFTPLILKDADEPTRTLRLRFLQNWGVRYLGSHANVDLALRLADGTQAQVHARVLSPGEVIADTSSVHFGRGSQIVIAQLVYRGGPVPGKVDLPLAGYQWSAERPDIDFDQVLAFARVRSIKPVYASGERLQVAWDGIEGPSRQDQVAVYRVDVAGATRISFARTAARSSGSMEIDAPLESGTFELRLIRNDSPEVMAVSAPFRVEGPSPGGPAR